MMPSAPRGIMRRRPRPRRELVRDERTELLLDGLISLTSALDGLAHVVTEQELCSPDAVHGGRYAALCGHLVAATPLAAPDGARCLRCAELRPSGCRPDGR